MPIGPDEHQPELRRDALRRSGVPCCARHFLRLLSFEHPYMDDRQPAPEVFIQLGFLDETKLKSALEFQATFRQQGVELSLGQVILNLGLATPDQVAKAIAHGATAILRCPKCMRRFTVPDFGATRRYKCEPCLTYLEIVIDESLQPAPATLLPSAPSVPAPAPGLSAPAPLSRAPTPAPAVKKDPFEGMIFGPYTIVRRIAKGGMGAVYLGDHNGTHEKVAIKILTEEFSRMPGIQGRFKREADTAGRLEHPNIVRQHEMAQQDTYIYIVSEFLEGGSLVDLIVKERRLAPRRAVELACDILSGLHHAHGRGVIHRDIKPANVLLTSDGRAKVIDFGLAKDAESQTILTLSGNVVGTPAYMAPEQAMGDSAGALADLYSVGILLYLMLTGKKPFEGRSIVDTLNKQINEPLPSARALNPEVSEELEKVLRKICEKKPSKRYPTLPEAIAALNRSVGFKADPLPAEPAIARPATSVPPPAVAQAPASAPAPADPVWDWVWAGVGVAAVVGALAWRLLKG